MIGSNLLSVALSVIGTTTISLYRFVSRSANTIGNLISLYEYPVECRTSVQAVPRDLMHQLGLDMQKDYIMVYAVDDVNDIMRDTSGDIIQWRGKFWQSESSTDWQAIDGWQGTLFVECGEVTPTLDRVFDDTFDGTFA
jgi:hypothetical protein